MERSLACDPTPAWRRALAIATSNHIHLLGGRMSTVGNAGRAFAVSVVINSTALCFAAVATKSDHWLTAPFFLVSGSLALSPQGEDRPELVGRLRHICAPHAPVAVVRPLGALDVDRDSFTHTSIWLRRCGSRLGGPCGSASSDVQLCRRRQGAFGETSWRGRCTECMAEKSDRSGSDVGKVCQTICE